MHGVLLYVVILSHDVLQLWKGYNFCTFVDWLVLESVQYPQFFNNWCACQITFFCAIFTLHFKIKHSAKKWCFNLSEVVFKFNTRRPKAITEQTVWLYPRKAIIFKVHFIVFYSELYSILVYFIVYFYSLVFIIFVLS